MKATMEEPDSWVRINLSQREVAKKGGEEQYPGGRHFGEIKFDLAMRKWPLGGRFQKDRVGRATR